MTKRWSGTRSEPSVTKRASSKRARREGRFFWCIGSQHRLQVIEDPRMVEDVVELWLEGRCVGRIVNIGGEVEDGEGA